MLINPEAGSRYLDHLIKKGKIIRDEYQVDSPISDSGITGVVERFLKRNAAKKRELIPTITDLHDSLQRKLRLDPESSKKEYYNMGQPKVVSYQRTIDVINGSLEFLLTEGGPHDGELQIIQRKNILLSAPNQITRGIEARYTLTTGGFIVRSNIETEDGIKLIEHRMVWRGDFYEQIGDQIPNVVGELKLACRPYLWPEKDKLSQLIDRMNFLRTGVENRMAFLGKGALVNTCSEEIFPIEYSKTFNLKPFGVKLTLIAGDPNDREVRGEYTMNTKSETENNISKKTTKFRIKANGDFSIQRSIINQGGETTEECEVIDGKLQDIGQVCVHTVGLIEGVVQVLSFCLKED